MFRVSLFRVSKNLGFDDASQRKPDKKKRFQKTRTFLSHSRAYCIYHKADDSKRDTTTNTMSGGGREEEEKSTFVGRNSKVWFIWTWSLLIFILCGIVYPPEAPPGESNMEYGGAVMLMVCVVALFWGGFSIRKTESTFKAEMKRKAETKTLAELMSINMGGA